MMGKQNPMPRVAYGIAQVTTLLLAFYIKSQIEKKNDQRKIFVPGVTSPFDPTPNYDELTETTYVDYESSKVQEFIKQTLMGASISMFIHFKMGVNHVVLLQSVMTPMNLYDNPLVRSYILGFKEERLWNERLEGETEIQTETTKTTKTTTVKHTPEEAIAETLTAGANANFEQLWEVVKDDVNCAAGEDKWTALMVACGSPIDTDSFIKKIIERGANVLAADGDGWTALHWSAFHGRPEAAEALLQECSSIDRKELITIKSKDGRTAIELAKEEENNDVVDVIERFMTSSTDEESSMETELRRRKPAKEPYQGTAIGDVD